MPGRPIYKSRRLRRPPAGPASSVASALGSISININYLRTIIILRYGGGVGGGRGEAMAVVTSGPLTTEGSTNVSQAEEKKIVAKLGRQNVSRGLSVVTTNGRNSLYK